MKKILILFTLCFSIGFTNANPIPMPPVISEFYLINDSTWYLEIVIPSMLYYNTNFDGMRIETSSGESFFKNGIALTLDSIIIITSDSMQSAVYVNRDGDFIRILSNGGGEMDCIYFGSNSWSQITAPSPGQSIVNYQYECYSFSLELSTIHYLVKDNSPSIGYNPFLPTDALGTFCGHVYDSGLNPVNMINIGYHTCYFASQSICDCYTGTAHTDSTGFFSIQEYSRNHFVEIYFQPYNVLGDSYINIEPDSMNYYDFILDTLLVGSNLNEFGQKTGLSCYPNPSNCETTISFSLPQTRRNMSALIKIYKPDGEMVTILPVELCGNLYSYSVIWNGRYYDNTPAQGIYFCKLEIDGQQIATSKLIISE